LTFFMSLVAEGVSGKKRRRSTYVGRHDGDEAEGNGLTPADKLDLKVLSKLPAVQSECVELLAEPGHPSRTALLCAVLRRNSVPC
jgi:hypothetical protein